jgi:membrane-associated protease RseP (regulator of RpoE activity)
MKRMYKEPTVLLALCFLAAGVAVPAVSSPQKSIAVVAEEKLGAWLGVSIQDLDKELREELGVEERRGAVVLDVVEDSPAEEAGLQENDVIIEFDGEKIRDTKVEIVIVRDGKKKTIEVTLGKRPKKLSKSIFISPGKRGSMVWLGSGPGVWMGVELQELNASLAEYFQVEEDGGVLITEVEEESVADEAGLRPGDVIVAMDGEGVSDADDIYDFLENKEEGDSVEIEYVRKGKRAKTTVELEECESASIFSKGFPQLFKWDDDHKLRYYFQLPDKEMLSLHLDKERLKDLKEKIRDHTIRIRGDWDDEIDELRGEIKKLKEEIEKLRSEKK